MNETKEDTEENPSENTKNTESIENLSSEAEAALETAEVPSQLDPSAAEMSYDDVVQRLLALETKMDNICDKFNITL